MLVDGKGFWEDLLQNNVQVLCLIYTDMQQWDKDSYDLNDKHEEQKDTSAVGNNPKTQHNHYYKYFSFSHLRW